MPPPKVLVENLYKILKILDEVNCFINFRSLNKILTQQTVWNAISKGLGRRIENSDVKGSFKNFIFLENV